MNEREAKIRKLLAALTANPDDLRILNEGLHAAGHGLRRQIETTPFPAVTDPERLASARTGIVLDSETEGLDPKQHRVIQLSMQKFLYDEQGIISLGDFFDRYRDPGRPIDPEITRITGITDDMVKGQQLQDQEISDWIADADRIVAHNAEFDRTMCEATFGGAGFDRKVWDCSLEQIDWAARGEKGRSLELLALHQGYVYQAHNAASDIRATLFVLNAAPPEGGRTPFAEMLERGANDKIHVFADGSSYDAKDDLKADGYRWAPPDEPVMGKGKVWHKIFEATEENIEAQRDLLRRVYRRDVSLPAFRFTGLERYSARRPVDQEPFKTAAPDTALKALEMMAREPEPAQPGFGF